MEKKDLFLHNLKEVNEYLEKLTLKVGGKQLFEKLKKEVADNNKINLKIYIDEGYDNSDDFIAEVQKILPRVSYQKVEAKAHLTDILKAGAKVLPFFVFDDTIKTNPGFRDLIKNKMIVTNDNKNFFIPYHYFAANRLHLDRTREQGRVDFFSVPGAPPSDKTKELLENNNIKFKMHTHKSELWKEMNVKMAPSFLLDNVYFFEGLHPFANTKYKGILPVIGQ